MMDKESDFKDYTDIDGMLKSSGILSAITEFNTDSPSDEEILRISISAELSAVNLYQELSELTSNPKLKRVLLDIAREEKVHIGEFEALLDIIDEEYEASIEEGKQEVGGI